ncbi:hypothetical protein JAAARDRAFT_33878 [Jaapia argillacea MUCL 33604]|uniref:Uncharacterized protein n=1 Tax=Jaapia argillacea MUCL 33604 TaxID=933084 RepID=A0A067PWR0_9AGAM|nr:hypothetical protein JAAARDRAFT_33878 [Jaapia argillacea MUCL 33604]
MSNNSSTASTPTSTYPSFFRRRTFGRAPSPPTWACYEQIPYDDEDLSDSASEDNSCSEDEENYGRGDVVQDSDSESDNIVQATNEKPVVIGDDLVHNMDIDEVGDGGLVKKDEDLKKDVKGKQRAVEPEMESPRKEHRRRRREPVYNLRPILTIQKSQGFVWNQDLFVPPYIKDRYVASTSPAYSSSFVSTSASSTNSCLNEYEVEVVEIRVKEGDLQDIIP